MGFLVLVLLGRKVSCCSKQVSIPCISHTSCSEPADLALHMSSLAYLQSSRIQTIPYCQLPQLLAQRPALTFKAWPSILPSRPSIDVTAAMTVECCSGVMPQWPLRSSSTHCRCLGCMPAPAPAGWPDASNKPGKSIAMVMALKKRWLPALLSASLANAPAEAGPQSKVVLISDPLHQPDWYDDCMSAGKQRRQGLHQISFIVGAKKNVKHGHPQKCSCML